MSTNHRISITEVRAGDRIVYGQDWLGPFVRDDAWTGDELTVIRTVNGGYATYPKGTTVEVIRGQEPTGDPGEGY